MDAAALESLDRERYLNVATFRRSGVAVETPVWAARRGDAFYVFTGGESGKVKRLRNDPRIRVAPCDVRGRVRGPWRHGRARLVQDESTIELAYAALRRKYGWQLRVVDWLSRITGRIRVRAMLELRLDPEPPSATASAG